jgi:hypothetical protein
MKYELLAIESEENSLMIRELKISPSTFGIIEGVNNETIRENLEFQGSPFGQSRPILFVGLDDFPDLAETFLVWARIEASPKDETMSFSGLDACFIVKDWSLATPNELRHWISEIDYWQHCKDFDF